MNLKIKVLNDNVYHLPSRSEPLSVGYDIWANENVDIYPGEIKKIGTGLSMTPPSGYYIQIMSRSSFAVQNIHVVAGTLDPSYTGEVFVVLENRGNKIATIDSGTRCAQLVLIKFTTPPIEIVSELDKTLYRGSQGFGSSGRTLLEQKCYGK
jgi:dUTP pyrophosphatase